METVKSKTELIREMQNIAEDVEKRKQEVELLLQIIEDLESKYFLIAEEIKKI